MTVSVAFTSRRLSCPPGFDGPGLVSTSCCSGVRLKTFSSLLLFRLLR